MGAYSLKRGYLSQYFSKVAIKRLSAVEVDPSKSNQHEFNGVQGLRKIFGTERISGYPAVFIWIGGENEGITEEGKITWYDARERHPTRTEYRLYFSSNPVMDNAKEGDLLIVAKKSDGQVYVIVVEYEETVENQFRWLFGLQEGIGNRFSLREIDSEFNPEVDFAARYILEELGMEIEEPDDDHIDSLIEEYIEKGFPGTREFSEFARRTLPDVSVLEDPDDALVKWMEHEEKLFKRLERHIVARKLEKGFVDSQSGVDVDGFIKFSLSVHNRRKSRVGYALEHHLEEVFRSHGIRYSRNQITENRSKPDFLFPGANYYHDPEFPASRLTMLGVKSTCKDRWRQVLAEAARIKNKHLFTLEPGISEDQTAEMQANSLQLVLPAQLHETYKPGQRSWLMNLREFLDLVRERQTGT
mgnify:CR=1 FL=1